MATASHTPGAALDGHDPKRPDGLCGAKTKAGSPCQLRAGWGTDHLGVGTCRRHGGSTWQMNTYSATVVQQHKVNTVRARWEVPDEIDHVTWLEEELRRTTAAVRFLDTKVQELTDEEMVFGKVKETTDGIKLERTYEERASTWVKLWQAERKHGSTIAKTMAELGIETIRNEIEASKVALVVQAVSQAIEQAPGDPERAKAIVIKHLRALDG